VGAAGTAGACASEGPAARRLVNSAIVVLMILLVI
jgi:hypothetical protein